MKKQNNMELQIIPKTTALLVIDMQTDFYAQKGGAAKRGKKINKMQSVATKIDQFVSKVGNKIGLLIFTKYLSGKGVTPTNLQKVADKENYSLMCEKDSGLEEISGVKIPQNAIIIEKPHYDSFAYTNLLTLLKNKGIKTVLVTGVRTEVCVDATAKRAASEGFDTVVLSDLVATYDDKEQVNRDTLLFFGKYYGYVVDSLTIIQKLKL